MLEPFGQIRPIFDRQGDKISLEVWVLLLQRFKLHQVRLEVLCTTPDSAQRAKEVLHAKAGTMKPHTINGEVVPKHQVLTAAFNAPGNRLMLWQRFHIIDDIEPRFCLSIPIDSFWQRSDTF